jgi:hypothetical protein
VKFTLLSSVAFNSSANPQVMLLPCWNNVKFPDKIQIRMLLITSEHDASPSLVFTALNSEHTPNQLAGRSSRAK